MKPITRKGDALAGHGCWGDHNIAEGDPTFLINGIPASFLGASSTVHCCGPACHSGGMAGENHFILNGLSAQKINDPVDCGSTQIAGDPTFQIE